MAKPMKHRDMERALLDNGCTWRQGKGDHEMWYCPCGKHSTPIVRDRIVSAGVVRQAIQRLSCLPEGWLQ